MPLPGIPFLKSSSGASTSTKTPPVAPARPPSPLSAANAGSVSKRPATASSTITSAGRKASASRGTPSISSSSSITGSLSARALPAPAELQPPPTSQSSRSLSSRLLRRRPSEKSSLARTPRLPALVSAASESDGTSELLTGSTTGGDVFAEQQDMWGAMPLMSAEERKASEVERAAERVGRLTKQGSGEAGPWRSGESEGNPWLRRGSEGSNRRGSGWTPASPYPVSSESPYYMQSGYTALPPPPRPGAKRYDRAEKEEMIADNAPVPQSLPWDMWGRRASDPVKYAAQLAALPDIDLPSGHPFLQSNTPPASNAPTPVRTDSDRDSALAMEKQHNDSGRSRFGDAPPMPSHPSRDDKTFFSPPKRSLPKSPRANRVANRMNESGFTPPPRSSSRLNNAASQSDISASPYVSSANSYKNSVQSGQQASGSTRLRSNSVSSITNPQSPHHTVVPRATTTSSPVPPLQYQLAPRSPKSSTPMYHLERSAVLSPTRLPEFAPRSSDQQSLGSSDSADVDSDNDEQDKQPDRGHEGGYEVSVACTQSAAGSSGEIKWEVTLRPSTAAAAASASAPPIRLSGATAAAATSILPTGATHVQLMLAVDKLDGSLSFIHPTLSGDAQATPTRPPRGDKNGLAGLNGHGLRGAGSQTWGAHSRAGTFGMGEGKVGDGAETSLSSSVSLESVEEENKLDRRAAVTPPPRMTTPPPMPSHPYSTTPISSAKKRQPHSRSTSYGDQPRVWALSPAITTPTAADTGGMRTPPRTHTPRELTYVSSPSPRGTPRRTRLVSASQLNGGLFAHGTVDDLSEQTEGSPV